MERRKHCMGEERTFKNRQLKEDWFCMIIDGYHCQIKDKQVKDAVIYIVLLISLEGKKEIGTWYIEFGKENRTDWMKILKDGIKKIMIGCQNFEQAIEEFNLLIEKYKKKYPSIL